MKRPLWVEFTTEGIGDRSCYLGFAPRNLGERLGKLFVPIEPAQRAHRRVALTGLLTRSKLEQQRETFARFNEQAREMRLQPLFELFDLAYGRRFAFERCLALFVEKRNLVNVFTVQFIDKGAAQIHDGSTRLAFDLDDSCQCVR